MQTTSRSPFGQLSVLVVDDNRHMRRILSAMLGAFGCRSIEACADGETALEIVARNDPGLILANINMPRLDGLELTRTIRNPALSSNPFRPVILLSAYSDPQHVMAARNAGADEFLHKPVQPASLYHAIAAALQDTRAYIRTKTYFGPDRRRNGSRPEPRRNPGRTIKIGNRIVRDFAGFEFPAFQNGQILSPDAA